MGARFVSLLAVLVLMAGCSSKPADTASVSTDGGLAATQAPVTGVDGTGAAVGANGAVTPGSEQDLVVNIGDRVFFGYDQHDLSGEARTTIEKQAQWLKTYPQVHLMIEGHADERGTREYNLALGEQRAMAIRNYLIALGIEASRVQTISYGKERPAVTGSDESAWAQNRRGVAVVQ